MKTKEEFMDEAADFMSRPDIQSVIEKHRQLMFQVELVQWITLLLVVLSVWLLWKGEHYLYHCNEIKQRYKFALWLLLVAEFLFSTCSFLIQSKTTDLCLHNSIFIQFLCIGITCFKLLEFHKEEESNIQ